MTINKTNTILKLFFFEFGNPKVTVHKGEETIQGRKLYEEILEIVMNGNTVYFFSIAISGGHEQCKICHLNGSQNRSTGLCFAGGLD